MMVKLLLVRHMRFLASSLTLFLPKKECKSSLLKNGFFFKFSFQFTRTKFERTSWKLDVIWLKAIKIAKKKKQPLYIVGDQYTDNFCCNCFFKGGKLKWEFFTPWLMIKEKEVVFACPRGRDWEKFAVTLD